MMGLGTDIAAIERFRGIGGDASRVNRIFTEDEIAYCLSKAVCSESFAGHFAAKEAVIKAFASFDMKFSLKQVEIMHLADGRPYAHIPTMHEYDILLSIAHEKEYAIATALIKKRKL